MANEKNFTTMTLKELMNERQFLERQLKHFHGIKNEIEKELDRRFEKGDFYGDDTKKE